MKAAALAAVIVAALFAAGASQAASAGCNDSRWLNGMTPAINQAVSAYTVASNGSYYAGESKLRSALASAHRAGSPCNTMLKGAKRNWLKGVNISLVGFDQAQAGNYSAAISSTKLGSVYIRMATEYLTAYTP